MTPLPLPLPGGKGELAGFKLPKRFFITPQQTPVFRFANATVAVNRKVGKLHGNGGVTIVTIVRQNARDKFRICFFAVNIARDDKHNARDMFGHSQTRQKFGVCLIVGRGIFGDIMQIRGGDNFITAALFPRHHGDIFGMPGFRLITAKNLPHNRPALGDNGRRRGSRHPSIIAHPYF